MRQGPHVLHDIMLGTQDRGDVHGFFPPEGDQQAHTEALERTPNLAAYPGIRAGVDRNAKGCTAAWWTESEGGAMPTYWSR